LQCQQLGFVFFQQTQTSPNNIAGAAITASLYLGVNKTGEVLAESH
jgi:hypothetical protein